VLWLLNLEAPVSLAGGVKALKILKKVLEKVSTP
jgi:hypothetical protein